ncbi:PI-PLC X domain-containing protein [Vitis vinifera]|uniref:PI-PLC X domain-containing protein n=1 Tax=Vitis vinifera TaxID=29760 RepID=A0A438DV25_VITVI|nr:PI-PLC X domain-containing protein [Vitis vinifera]
MGLAGNLLFLLVSLIFCAVATADCSNGGCQLHDKCSSHGDCAAGLFCFSCSELFSDNTCVRSTVTNQFSLLSGVRGLMLDAYDFKGDVWLCHSFDGKCFDFTAFGPAIDTFKEIEAFLSANPTEIVTLILEDYHATKWSGLALVSDMIAKNQRLVVFTSAKYKENSEGIAYQWNYMVENQYGDGGLQSGNCTARGESPPLTI